VLGKAGEARGQCCGIWDQIHGTVTISLRQPAHRQCGVLFWEGGRWLPLCYRVCSSLNPRKPPFPCKGRAWGHRGAVAAGRDVCCSLCLSVAATAAGSPASHPQEEPGSLLYSGTWGRSRPALLRSPEPARAGLRQEPQSAEVSWVSYTAWSASSFPPVWQKDHYPSSCAVILVVPVLLSVKQVLSLVYAWAGVSVFSYMYISMQLWLVCSLSTCHCVYDVS